MEKFTRDVEVLLASALYNAQNPYLSFPTASHILARLGKVKRAYEHDPIFNNMVRSALSNVVACADIMLERREERGYMKRVKGTVNVSTVKHCYINLDINVVCPKCKSKISYDSTQSLSYPKDGNVELLQFYCDNCDGCMHIPAKVRGCFIDLECHFDKLVMEG